MATVSELDAQIAALEGQIASAQAGGGSAGPDYSSFFKSPGYEFRLDEGIRALDRSAAARGKLHSGGYGRELTRYGQGFASSEFNQYANRLASLAGIGQTSTGASAVQSGSGAGFGATAVQTGQGIGSAVQQGGTARASGYVGAANAWNQGLGNLAYLGSQYFGGNQYGGGGYDPMTGINWATGRQGV